MSRLLAVTVAFCLVVIIVLPTILVRGCSYVSPPEVLPGPTIRVYIAGEKKMEEMPLEVYLKGVVAAEMPASFPVEALKAQAVAARTFAAKRMVALGGPGCQAHPGADVCTDPRHCQAWLSQADSRRRWGYLEGLVWWRKISHAVDSTAGLVAKYNGSLIDAAFHSACGGSTENSEDVWSARVPYLRAVQCKFCGESRPFSETKEFTISEFERRLGVTLRQQKAVVRQVGGQAVRVITNELRPRPVEVVAGSPSGRIKTASIGGKMFTALQLRDALGLRSTRINWQFAGDRIRINTVGYGHGAGLCQYGAAGMASDGRSFREILQHYYKGIDIASLYAAPPMARDR